MADKKFEARIAYENEDGDVKEVVCEFETRAKARRFCIAGAKKDLGDYGFLGAMVCRGEEQLEEWTCM